MDLIVNIMLGIIVAATPLVFASIGELVVEKSGVLNLGVEGMMIIGAIAGFAATIETGSFLAGVIAAALAGAAVAFLFAVLTQTLLANQVATGLALTLFGLGLAALIGQAYSGKSAPDFPHLHIPYLTDLPIIGPLIFGQDALVYLSLALVAGVAWFLTRTRTGLIIRAIGENHDAAHAIGYPVVAYRYAALMFGGACAGLGGAYLSIVQTPLGAYLFGGITIVQLHSQALGLEVEPQLLAMLPYLATIVVLVLISHDKTKVRLNAPANLGKTFFAST
jgi:ABC-type uncharacterized transport system permease subunit